MNKRNALLHLMIIVIAVYSGRSLATSSDKPCAVLTKIESGSQIIPPKGSIPKKNEVDMPIYAGSTLSTHHGVLWFKHLTQTTIKLSQEAFVEIGTADHASDFYLYRGGVILNSAPLHQKIKIQTPNGLVDFDGGVALIEYHSDTHQTTVASFNRSLEFRNRFNDKAVQTVKVGEVSTLTVSTSRIVPSTPEVMSAAKLHQALIAFELPAEEEAQLVSIVEKVYDTRSKSLVSEISTWNEESPRRSIASESAKGSIDSIDPEEAEHSIELMKKHLYGEEVIEPSAKVVERKPAAVEPAFKDSEYERVQNEKKKDSKNVLKGISKLKTDDSL